MPPRHPWLPSCINDSFLVWTNIYSIHIWSVYPFNMAIFLKSANYSSKPNFSCLPYFQGAQIFSRYFCKLFGEVRSKRSKIIAFIAKKTNSLTAGYLSGAVHKILFTQGNQLLGLKLYTNMDYTITNNYQSIPYTKGCNKQCLSYIHIYHGWKIRNPGNWLPSLKSPKRQL